MLLNILFYQNILELIIYSTATYLPTDYSFKSIFYSYKYIDKVPFELTLNHILKNNIQLDYNLVDYIDKKTVIISAIKHKNLDLVKYAYEKSKNNESDDYDYLIYASYFGIIEIAKFFLDKGIKPLKECFRAACTRKKKSMILLLQETGMDLTDIQPSFVAYIFCKSAEIFEHLVTLGADYKYENYCIFYKACMKDRQDIVKYFLKNYLEDIPGNVLDNALYYACNKEKIKIVNILLKNNADPNMIETSPLRIACKKGNFKIVHALVDAGANIYAENCDCLVWACRRGHVEIVKYLIDKGADLSVNNYRPLRRAIKYERYVVLEYLRILLKF